MCLNFKKFSRSCCLLIYFLPTCMYIGHFCKNEETETGDSGGSGEAGDSQKSGHSDDLGESDDSGDTSSSSDTQNTKTAEK